MLIIFSIFLLKSKTSLLSIIVDCCSLAGISAAAVSVVDFF